MRKTKIFAGSSHQYLAKRIGNRLGAELGQVRMGKYDTKETWVEIQESVRDQDVYIIQSCCGDVNDMMMELSMMIHDCHIASAQRVTAVLPFLPYSKQSKKKRPRGGITAKLLANMLRVAGVNHMVTMDLHASQIQGFYFNIPFDNLSAEPCIASYIENNIQNYTQAVIVAKNAGAAKHVTSLADRLKIDFALIHRISSKEYHGGSSHAGGNGQYRFNYIPSPSLSARSPLNGKIMHADATISALGTPLSIHLSECTEVRGLHQKQPSLWRSNSSLRLNDADNEKLDTEAKDNSDESDEGIIYTGKWNNRNGNVNSSRISSARTPVKSAQLNDHGPEETTLTLVGDVSNRLALLMDDILDNCEGFIQAAECLKEAGAKMVIIVVTHALLSNRTAALLQACSYIDEVIVTNTIPLPSSIRERCAKLRIIDISATLAEAIRRIHNGESVSLLLNGLPMNG